MNGFPLPQLFRGLTWIQSTHGFGLPDSDRMAVFFRIGVTHNRLKKN